MRRHDLVWVVALLLTTSCGASDLAAEKGAQIRLTLESGPAAPSPGDTVTFRADLVNSPYEAASYYWSVTDALDVPLKVTEVGAAGSMIRFKVSKPGNHRIFCQVTLEGQGGMLSNYATLSVDDPSYLKRTYTVRLLPPPGSGLPPVDRSVVIGGVDREQNLQLEQGQQVSLKVSGSAGAAPALVRLFRLGADPLPRDVYLPTGSGKVKLTGSFHALVIPDALDVAPTLLPNQTAASIGPTWAITLDSGKLIQGKVVRADATPMAGATVTIHTKNINSGVDVPSTVATTGSDGTFSVRASLGPAVVSVVPPAGAGLPAATIKNSSLMVASDASGWIFTFAGAKPVQVAGKVTHSDGTTAASGVHVVLTASGVQVAGSLSAGGATLKATGVLRRTLTTDASGALKDPLTGSTKLTLPAGTYTADLWPGSASSGPTQGYARSSVDLTGAAPAPLALSLAKRVSLSGAIKGPDGKAVLARVVATSSSGQFAATSDAAGSFSMDLDDKTSYSLMVRPLGTEQRLSRHVETNLSISGPRALQAITLTRAIAFTGRVVSGNAGIPGAAVRIWCSSADCPSKEVVDEVQTASDGSFELLVPPSPKAAP